MKHNKSRMDPEVRKRANEAFRQWQLTWGETEFAPGRDRESGFITGYHQAWLEATHEVREAAKEHAGSANYELSDVIEGVAKYLKHPVPIEED